MSEPNERRARGPRRTWIRTVAACALALALFEGATPARPTASGPEGDPPFLADPADCVCGIADPRRVVRPARVDLAALLEVTPQVRRMRREGIEPESPAGIQLLARAQDLVRAHCREHCARAGHCSAWRRIRRRDGRPVADVTDGVRARIVLDGAGPAAPGQEARRSSSRTVRSMPVAASPMLPASM